MIVLRNYYSVLPVQFKPQVSPVSVTLNCSQVTPPCLASAKHRVVLDWISLGSVHSHVDHSLQVVLASTMYKKTNVNSHNYYLCILLWDSPGKHWIVQDVTPFMRSNPLHSSGVSSVRVKSFQAVHIMDLFLVPTPQSRFKATHSVQGVWYSSEIVLLVILVSFNFGSIH